MTRGLNGWQRIWVVIAGILLLLFVGVALDVAPSEDALVLQDLQDPSCESPISAFQYKLGPPSRELNRCYNVLYFEWLHDVNIHNVEEYRHELRAEKRGMILRSLVAWLGLVLAIYLLGFSLAWVRRGFRSAHG